ncbi:MAG: hypothetical protein R3F43_23515 [bacterium]
MGLPAAHGGPPRLHRDDCGLLFGCTAGASPAAARAFGWRTSVAFFKVHLLGDQAWQPWLTAPVAAAGARLERR